MAREERSSNVDAGRSAGIPNAQAEGAAATARIPSRICRPMAASAVQDGFQMSGAARITFLKLAPPCVSADGLALVAD
jgi:hypothetical protein